MLLKTIKYVQTAHDMQQCWLDKQNLVSKIKTIYKINNNNNNNINNNNNNNNNNNKEFN